MREITQHIVHCSDSNFGDVVAIRRWHLARGWRDVGYHFIIRKDGEIEIGRTLDEVGAHCRGYNKNSVGTCLIGRDDFSEKQLKSLNRLQIFLRILFPEITVHGHREFNSNKTCPNFNIEEVIENV